MEEEEKKKPLFQDHLGFSFYPPLINPVRSVVAGELRQYVLHTFTRLATL